MALIVFAVWYATPGCVPDLVRGARGPAEAEEPVAIFEPQIPEYNLLAARRRQDAIERASRVQQWEAEQLVHEDSYEHRKRVLREQAIRRERLERVEDLAPLGYRLIVLDVATRFAVDPRLVAAVSTVESKWYARARGSHGDSGLMQILPSTAAWIAPRMGLADYDLFDPLTNLSMGAWYLKTLRSQYGSWERALAAYNGGPKAAGMGWGHPYVSRIMHVYRWQGSNMSYIEPSQPR